jgi:hypothetical protein
MPTIPQLLPKLPQPGQYVKWRNPQQARAWGWESALGPGPFEVVATAFNRDATRATGIILRTLLGEREVSEVWLELADDLPMESAAPGKRSAGG